MQLASVCPLDCPDTCSLSVTVEDDRVVAVRGSKANPYTAGVLCAKVANAYPDFVHGANRSTRPLRRVGAQGEGRLKTYLDERSAQGLDAEVGGYSFHTQQVEAPWGEPVPVAYAVPAIPKAH